MSLSINQCKQILGKSKETLTDSEIEQIRNIFVVLSDLAIDSYTFKRESESKKQKYENK